MKSPKIYLLQTNDGKFILKENKIYSKVSKICNANFLKSKSDIEIIKKDAELFLQESLHVFESNEDDFIKSMHEVTAQAIITGGVFYYFLETINYTLPTISQINKNLKNHIKNTLSHLQSTNEFFNKIENENKDAVFEISGHFQETVKILSEIPLNDLGELNLIIKAFKKDKKSILGIAKKIYS